MTLREQVELVARLRAAAAEAKRQQDESYRAWQAANELLIGQRVQCDQDLETAERTLRDAALATYYTKLTNKCPAPGVTIKVFQRVDYDPPTALKWAKQHGICLTLDKPAFEKIAKSGQVDCATVVSEPRVQLASDLDAALDAAFEGEGTA